MFLLGYAGLSWPGQPKVQTEYNSKSYLWKRSDKRGGDRRLSFDVPAWTPSSCPGGRFLYGTLRPPWPPLTAASTTDPSSSPPLWTRPGWRGCRRCPGPGHKPSRYFKHCVSKHQREAKGKIVSFLSSNCNNTSVWISNAASNQLMPASFTRLRSESVSKPFTLSLNTWQDGMNATSLSKFLRNYSSMLRDLLHQSTPLYTTSRCN